MVPRVLCFIVGLTAVLVFIRPFEGQRGAGIAGAPGGALARGVDNTPTTAPVQPPPITDFDTVLLTVNVTGPQNNSVPGIPRERFQILEDGVEQQISYFFE